MDPRRAALPEDLGAGLGALDALRRDLGVERLGHDLARELVLEAREHLAQHAERLHVPVEMFEIRSLFAGQALRHGPLVDDGKCAVCLLLDFAERLLVEFDLEIDVAQAVVAVDLGRAAGQAQVREQGEGVLARVRPARARAAAAASWRRSPRTARGRRWRAAPRTTRA